MPLKVARNELTEMHPADLADIVEQLDIEAGDYVAVLRRLAALREPIDRYFDQVMVMVEDAQLRGNRLAMLSNLRTMFLRVADISLLPAM